MKKKRFNFTQENQAIVNEEHPMLPIIYSDVMGSYTGLTLDPLEKPVQDADDL